VVDVPPCRRRGLSASALYQITHGSSSWNQEKGRLLVKDCYYSAVTDEVDDGFGVDVLEGIDDDDFGAFFAPLLVASGISLKRTRSQSYGDTISGLERNEMEGCISDHTHR
jgi:hypothetical protein